MAETVTMPPQHVQAYKDATDNLIFLKKEQAQTTYYAWLLLAALYILAKDASPNARAFLQVGAGIVALFSVMMLWTYQGGIGKFRKRLNGLYGKYFTQDERSDLNLGVDKKDYLFFGLYAGACIVASAFTIYIIDNIPNSK